MNSIRRVTPSRKFAVAVYRRAAVTPLAQLFPITLALGLALMTLSLFAALTALALGEALLIAIVPHLGVFQRGVDARFDRAQRDDALMMRGALLGRMSESQRHELEELERLAAEIRERRDPGLTDNRPEVQIERWLCLDRLLVSYVRLAVAHRRNVEAFCFEKRAALDSQIARLETTRVPENARARAAIERQRAILARRERAWARACEERDLFAHELAATANVIRWMHELCAIGPSDITAAEIDGVLASLEQEHLALSSAMRDDETDTIDARTLELGREASLAAHSFVQPFVHPFPHASRSAPLVPERHVGSQLLYEHVGAATHAGPEGSAS